MLLNANHPRERSDEHGQDTRRRISFPRVVSRKSCASMKWGNSREERLRGTPSREALPYASPGAVMQKFSEVTAGIGPTDAQARDYPPFSAHFFRRVA